MSDTTSAVPAENPLVIEQRAQNAPFLMLSLKNGLLNIVTLTLYRFWGKTEVRRRVWNSTFINDEPLEYTGRGIELFIGFLLALVALGLPFLLLVFGVQLLGPAVAALIILPLYIFLTVLMGFGMFTAFRYLASRSVWRGVRFFLRGSASSYGVRYLGYLVLSSITLGWFWPAAQRRLAEPLWHGLRFGDRKFRFSLDEARREGVYGPFAIFWIGLAVGYVAFAIALVGAMAPLMQDVQESGVPPEVSFAIVLRVYGLLAVFAAALIPLYAVYQAAILRSITRGISFEGVRFRLKVGWAAMTGLIVTNVLLIVFTLGFLLPFVQMRTIRFIIRRLETGGGVDLTTVRQSSEVGPRYGEGLADAFGVAPI